MAKQQQWGDIALTPNSCALAGAAAFFAGVPDAKIIVNGSLWCYFYAMRRLERNLPDIDQRYFCSQPDNTAVIYGTEECLLEAIQEVRDTGDPNVLFIENSCSIGLIGDDIAGIARHAKLPFSMVCLDSGGMLGGFWEGYRAAVKAYFQALPLTPNETVESRSVNLLGVSDSYYQGAANRRELELLLASIGVKVIAAPGAGSSTETIRQMGRAELNLVVHAELGLELAQLLHHTYGTPYLSVMPPYGLEGTEKWLRQVAECLWLSEADLTSIEKQREAARKILQQGALEMGRTWGELWFERGLIAGPSSVAVGLGEAIRTELADVGDLTVMAYGGTSVAPSTEVDHLFQQQDLDALTEPAADLQDGDLLLSGSAEQTLFSEHGKKRLIMIPIASPVINEIQLLQRPAMGFNGMLYLAETLWNRTIALKERLQSKYD